MTYSTGNETRDAMLRRVIGEVLACHERPTLEAVAAGLPADFAVEQEEIDGMLGNMKPPPPEPFPVAPPGKLAIETTPAGDPLPTEAPAPAVTYTIEAATPAEAAAVVPKIAEAEARRQLDEVNARLGAAREALVNAQIVRRDRRAALAASITAWQLLSESATEGLTAEQRRQIEVRNHLAATAAERASRRKAHSGATAFVQKNMRNGPQRGAYSMQAAVRSGFVNHNPSRGPVEKPPEQ